ncbi:MAG: type II secretion system protein [Bacilli bacterium]|nr:type II secretion system protein [Bacilli bacterium]
MKKGITLIEILVVTVIFAILMLICVPTFNNQFNKYNRLNNIQINCYDQLIFYEKIKSILATTNDIEYEIHNDEILILLNNHQLVCNKDDELILDNVFYNVFITKKEIKKEYILFNVIINGKEQCIVLRGTINEIY